MLTKYVVADKDANGPFVRIPADIMERAQLNWLGYENAAEALAEKFHVSPRLLRDLNPRKEFNSLLISPIQPNPAVMTKLLEMTLE